MNDFVAEDNARMSAPHSTEDDAYEAFIEEYDMEPLRILDVTNGYDNAVIVWSD
jgi:hypothetical protein